ncbi:MAG: hypothetical protein JW716_03515 [Candidatus Aenigmarchaeota archaeon]|nr:hypothetical protein [Candidatus Aenigmarchaeota archaeon]
MSEFIGHNCGIAITYTLHDAHNFLYSLQHRGRDAAGIAAVGDTIDILKWQGSVKRFDLAELHKHFPDGRYQYFIAHNRYATRGRKDRVLQDAHPHHIGGKVTDYGTYIIVRGAKKAIVHNGQIETESLNIDKSRLMSGSDSEALLHYYDKHGTHGEERVLQDIPGSYSAIIADTSREGAIVIRDRYGIRPAALGWKDNKFVAASEDIAIRKNGGSFREDIKPGSVYYLYPDGKYDFEQIIKSPYLALCKFEQLYLADPESVIDGIPVIVVQQQMGTMLARESPKDADIVSFAPRRSEAAARAYANELGLPFVHLLTKESALRSFQGPYQKEREEAIQRNLHLLNPPYFERRGDIRREFKGAITDIVDDSIIRGTVGSTIAALVKPLDIIPRLRSYTPYIGRIRKDGVKTGCYDGVDMPPEETADHKFVARGRNSRGISKAIGMDTRALSVRGMKSAFRKAGMDPNNLCTFCIGGRHPYRKFD